jgi:hypothetical protein
MAGETATIPLIPTKLHRPPVAAEDVVKEFGKGLEKIFGK